MEQAMEQEEEQRAQGALAHGDAVLKMVGWYCAGGHDDDHGRPVTSPSVRLDDPCAHGVPMFVLTKIEVNATITPGDGSEQWPWDMLRGWINSYVRVTSRPYVGGPDSIDGLLVSHDPTSITLVRLGHAQPWVIQRDVVAKVDQIDDRQTINVNKNVRAAWDAEFNGIPANTPDNPADQ